MILWREWIYQLSVCFLYVSLYIFSVQTTKNNPGDSYLFKMLIQRLKHESHPQDASRLISIQQGFYAATSIGMCSSASLKQKCNYFVCWLKCIAQTSTYHVSSNLFIVLFSIQYLIQFYNTCRCVSVFAANFSGRWRLGMGADARNH